METKKLSLRIWSRLIDGEQPWGSLQVVPDRFGMTRFRLMVYPPGLSQSERRRLRVWRGWPMWGAAPWALSVLSVQPLTGSWPAIAIATAIYLGAGAVTRYLAGPTRKQVRTLSTEVLRGHHDPRSRAVASEISSLTHLMADADDRLARGEMTTVDHELTWWRVYQQLAPKRPIGSTAQREAA